MHRIFMVRCSSFFTGLTPYLFGGSINGFQQHLVHNIRGAFLPNQVIAHFVQSIDDHPMLVPVQLQNTLFFLCHRSPLLFLGFGCAVLLQSAVHSGGDLIGGIPDFRQGLPHLLWVALPEGCRQAAEIVVRHIHPIPLAQKIGCAVCLKCGIISVVVLTHPGDFRMGQLLGDTAENIFRSHAPAYENHLLVMVVQRTHVVGQGVHRLDGNGGTVNQSFQQHPVIQFHGRCRAHTPSGLGRIVDSFYLKRGATGAVLPIIFLAGFQKHDAGFALVDRTDFLNLHTQVH